MQVLLSSNRNITEKSVHKQTHTRGSQSSNRHKQGTIGLKQSYTSDSQPSNRHLYQGQSVIKQTHTYTRDSPYLNRHIKDSKSANQSSKRHTPGTVCLQTDTYHDQWVYNHIQMWKKARSFILTLFQCHFDSE